MFDILGTKDVGAWRSGIVGATDAALLPGTASPRGLNSALALSRMGVPYVQKRQGIACLTPDTDVETIDLTGIPGAPLAINYQFCLSDGSKHLLYSPDGEHSTYLDANNVRRFIRNPYTTDSAILAAVPMPTNTTGKLSAVEHNGTIYISGNSGAPYGIKIRPNGDVQRIGIVRPSIPGLSGAAGSAGLHNGTYELRVTYGNSFTGHESSASNTAGATVVASNEEIDWANLPISPDPQVDTRYLYARNINTQTQFYRVGTVADNTTTTATTSILDENMLIAAPGLTERGEFPTGQLLAVYRNRLFTVTPDGLRWSLINAPEAFDALNVDTVDAAATIISGIFPAHDGLIITYADRTYMLRGEVGDAYTIDLVDPNVGCVAPRSFVSAGGYTYWWSMHGLVRWDGNGPIQSIGLDLYGDVTETIAQARSNFIQAVPDHNRSTLYITVPALGQTRNTRILPFNYNLGVFEATYWDAMDAASLGYRFMADGRDDEVLLGSYGNQAFRMWSGHNDGVAADTTHTGTFTPATSSITTITDGDAEFDTDGFGLLERKLSIFDADNNLVTTTRPRITVNTATELTFTPAIAGLDTGSTYTYVIGGPDFQFDTAWRDFSTPFLKKRFEFLHLLTKGATFGNASAIDIVFDYNTNGAGAKERTFTSTQGGGTWDSAVWDVDVWDTPENVRERFRIGRVGYAYQLRIRNGNADQPFALLYTQVQAVGQTGKR